MATAVAEHGALASWSTASGPRPPIRTSLMPTGTEPVENGSNTLSMKSVTWSIRRGGNVIVMTPVVGSATVPYRVVPSGRTTLIRSTEARVGPVEVSIVIRLTRCDGKFAASHCPSPPAGTHSVSLLPSNAALARNATLSRYLLDDVTRTDLAPNSA